jgi:hypothetical protein
MPSTAEQKARARGLKGYRVVKKDGNTFLVAVVDKAGPRGGHTIALRGPVGAKAPAPVTRKKVSRKKLRKKLKARRAASQRVQ